MSWKVATLVVLLCAGRATHAAPPDATTSQAMAQFQLGLKHYNLSEWEAALKSFRDAYFIKTDPSFLFNIAQCLRQLGRFEAAEKSYRAFLRESGELSPEQTEQVERLILQMEEAGKETRMRQPPMGVVTPGARPATEIAVVAPPPKKQPLYKRWWLWTVVGAVAVGAGVGLGVGLSQGVRYPNPGGNNVTLAF